MMLKHYECGGAECGFDMAEDVATMLAKMSSFTSIRPLGILAPRRRHPSDRDPPPPSLMILSSVAAAGASSSPPGDF